MNKKFALAGLAAIGLASITNAQTYTTTGNIPIPDFPAPGVSIDLVIADNIIISDLNVGVILTTTWQGDYIATVTHLNTGTVATIINRPGGTGLAVGFSADNYGNLGTNTHFVLDDEAANIYDTPFVASPGINNVTGSWKPDGGPADGIGNLGVFDGENIQGTWRLTVSDNAGQDFGAIRSFQLVIPGPASLALLGLAGLAGKGRRRRD